MNIQHHPDLVWLIDYANGALSRGFRAVVGGHLRVCVACRADLASAHDLGTRLVAAAPALAPGSSAALARAHTPQAASSPAELTPLAGTGLADFIATELGFVWSALDWRRGTPGLRIARVRDSDDEHIWLLAAGASVPLPVHTHEGAELTLILTGAYASAGQEYAAGDVDDNDESVTHQPIVTARAACTSLLVFEGRLRYTGLIMRTGQKLLGF